MKPRALYIERFGASPDGWRRVLRPGVKPFTGQDGFFRGALHAAFDVVERPFSFLARNRERIEREFEWVIVNFKAARPKEGLSLDDLAPVKALRRCGRAVFVNYAAAGALPDDAMLDPFDAVFKRELLKDLDRYPISARNKAKLCATMLACPLARVGPRDLARFSPDRLGCADAARRFARDAFFIGADTNPMRRDALERLAASGVAFDGGLQAKSGRPAPPERLSRPRMKARDYLTRVRESKVNLALEGIGEFTFRHLELWGLCAFMLSSPSVRDVRTPLDVREGRDYVCFETMDDLVDKVRHFAGADAERERIARAGRRAFVEGYDFARHGAAIRAGLEAGKTVA
jgi:hypothetical protein